MGNYYLLFSHDKTVRDFPGIVPGKRVPKMSLQVGSPSSGVTTVSLRMSRWRESHWSSSPVHQQKAWQEQVQYRTVCHPAASLPVEELSPQLSPGSTSQDHSHTDTDTGLWTVFLHGPLHNPRITESTQQDNYIIVMCLLSCDLS